MKIVIVDLNGPLGGFNRRRAIVNLIRNCGFVSVAWTFVVYLIHHKMYRAMLRGEMGEKSLWEKVARGRVTAEKAYEAFSVTKKPLNSGMLRLLDGLEKQKKCKICLHSDIPKDRAEELRQDSGYKGLSELFADGSQFFSYSIKGTKSARETFSTVLKKLGANPHDVVFIDDNPINVITAWRCGMRVIMFLSVKHVKMVLVRILGP